MEQKKITIISKTQGQSLSIAGGSYRILVSGEQTDGAYAVIEMNVPPGGGPGPHEHAEIQETFYVVEGEVEFMTENGKHHTQTGAFVNIPFNGGVHGFKNRSEKMVVLLCTVVPAGLDSFFQEIGKPIAAGEFIPASPLSPEEMEKLKTIGEKYGQVFYPPNYLD